MQYPLEVSVSNCYSGGMANEMDALRLRIERLMKEQGRSARSLSLAIGQNSAYIQQLISGMRNKKPPSIQIMEAIADELGVSLAVLRGREPEFEELPEIQTVPLTVLLDRIGARPAYGQRAEDIKASAGKGSRIPQGYDDSRARKLVGGNLPERIQLVEVEGECMKNILFPGDFVHVDTQLSPEIGGVVAAVRMHDETLVKFLREKDGRQYLESKDGKIIMPLDQYIRILGPVVDVQRSIWRMIEEAQ